MSLSVSIKKRLGSFQLDVDFEAEDPSETLALLGASGSGKSVALKCIAGIERPDEGRIVLNDRVLFDSSARIDVPVQDRRVGYLFQSYALFPTMTVEQNVQTGVRASSRDERRSRAAEQIRAFRLEGLEHHRPAELSGGQQQRVALARIMANEPELLLLDEPFSALDGYLRWQLELELADTLKAFPGGVVFVTHNRDEVFRMCQRVCVLSDGKSGRCVPTRELFDAPATLAEALISGCKNVSAATELKPGCISCADWGVELACTQATAGCTHVGIRAHFLRVVEADGRETDTIGDAPTGFGSAAVVAPGSPGRSAEAGAPCCSEHSAEGGPSRHPERSSDDSPSRHPERSSEDGPTCHPEHSAGGGPSRHPERSAGGAESKDPPPSCQKTAANRIPCAVSRVIDNVFSTIVMCATPGGALLRVELEKDAWAALGDPSQVVLSVAPADVMPLVSGDGCEVDA